MVQAFVKILKKQMLKYLVVGAIGTQILEPLPVFVEALSKLLIDARNLFSYDCGLRSREEFGQKQSPQVI